MTDYGILLLTYVAKEAGAEIRTTRDLASQSRLPLPTVEKLLKALSRGKFLVSERGVKGGYRLARKASEITIAEVIETLEGPIGLTACSRGSASSCEVESSCPVQSHWRAINHAVRSALSDLTLAALLKPAALVAGTARLTSELSPHSDTEQKIEKSKEQRVCL